MHFFRILVLNIKCTSYDLKKIRRLDKLTPTVVKDSILAIGVTKVYHHGFDN